MSVRLSVWSLGLALSASGLGFRLSAEVLMLAITVFALLSGLVFGVSIVF